MLRTANDVLAHVARRLPDCQPTAAPERLAGGHLNYVWRVRADPRALIVKSAPPFIADLPDVALDADRVLFEARSLELLGPGGRLSMLCSDTLRVPVCLDLDTERRVLVMEDVGTLSDLAAELRRANVRPGWAHVLGRFIGGLHARTAGNAELSEEFCNAAVQQTRLDLQYRAIGTFLSAAGIDAAPRIALRAVELGERFAGPGVCLTMGDLWPASILVDGERLRLIDWEFAHFGRPAQDVGHLLAHLWMQAHRHSGTADETLGLADTFLGTYIDTTELAGATLLDAQFKADCAVHMGAEILMRTIGPFQRGYLYEGLKPDSRPVQEATGFATASVLAGDNELLRAIPPPSRCKNG
ncbi:MAG: phosphotransferase [Gammaproteobacteria bacterium]|nr:phosphotransferase [Gammaproteobacteria bacterium]